MCLSISISLINVIASCERLWKNSPRWSSILRWVDFSYWKERQKNILDQHNLEGVNVPCHQATLDQHDGQLKSKEKELERWTFSSHAPSHKEWWQGVFLQDKARQCEVAGRLGSPEQEAGGDVWAFAEANSEPGKEPWQAGGKISFPRKFNWRTMCEQAGQLDEGLDFVKSEVRILRIRVESGGRDLWCQMSDSDQIHPDGVFKLK